MTPLPLDHSASAGAPIGPHCGLVGSALSQTGATQEPFELLARWRAIGVDARLYVHAIPWLFIISILARLVIHGMLG